LTQGTGTSGGVADSELELRGEGMKGGFVLLALLAFLSSVISF